MDKRSLRARSLRAARSAAAALTVLALVVLATIPVSATPVCPDPPREPCGGRIFPEADMSTAFVQHDSGEYIDGIKALARDYPRFVKVTNFDTLLGKDVSSFDGRDIWMVEITDFKAPEKGKVPVVASLSVHGIERAGLEGGVRYMEDLARWAAEEPDHELRNGTEPDSVGFPVSQVLKRVHFYLANINPDGWADGDIANGGVFTRGNGAGVDLNREFPTLGWTKVTYTALSEPESKSWHALMQKIRPEVTTDIHGEITSANDAFADLMYPAGQWNPREQVQQERLARHMKSNVERYFEINQVDAGTATGTSGTMKPAEYATGYDVVGYDDSGFMGDYFTQYYGAIDMDVENFLSHLVPNSTWVASLEEAHIAAVRGQLETLIVEALVYERVSVSYNLGRVGYLLDPKIVTDADGYEGPSDPPKDLTPYRVTRMKFFKDLARFSTTPVRSVARRDVIRGGLEGLDSFVVADRPFPRDALGRKTGRPARMAAVLKAWVKNGGNLILTDKAFKLLHRMGIVPKSAVGLSFYNAGHINISDWDAAYVKGVHHTASQTYYEVPLGFSADADASPHWWVDVAAWTEAGGKAVAYTDEDDPDTPGDDRAEVGLGRLKLGKGTIGIFGAVLPEQTEQFDHYYGLADYAVTVAAGQILNNMFRFAL